MASVSVSHLILFIAAMLIAASVAGVLTTTVEDISRAIDDQGISVSDNIRTSVEIINDPGACVFDCNNDGQVRLFVKNTGTTELTPTAENIDVLVNGQFATVENVTVLEGRDTWSQDAVVRINATGDAVDGGEQNRAKVIVNGDEDVLIWEES